jgi:hypothetical protein
MGMYNLENGAGVSSEKIASGIEKILLVEDDKSLRQVIALTLASATP